MNDRKNNANFLAQLQQQTKQRDRVRPARNRDADAVPGLQEFMFPNVGKYGLPQALHGNIVQPEIAWIGSLLVTTPTNDCSFSSSPKTSPRLPQPARPFRAQFPAHRPTPSHALNKTYRQTTPAPPPPVSAIQFRSRHDVPHGLPSPP